jgi:hypothetical protein
MTDDHLHSCEAGIMMNLAEVAYHGLTAKELTEIEKIIQVKVMSGRSSANDDYPRGTVKSGFGKLTLCSHKEKVGSVFYLLLALHDKRGHEIIEKANKRQKKKYLTFPSKSVVMSISKEPSHTKKRTANQGTSSSNGESEHDSNNTSQLPVSAFPYRKDLMFGNDHSNRYPFPQDDQSIEFVCRHLCFHGFGFLLETSLDAFQLDHLMITSWGILCPLKKLSNPYPSKDALQTICSDTEVINAIVDEDDDDDDDPKQSSVEETCKVILPRELPSREIDTKDAESSDNEHVKHQRLLTIFGCIPKHCQKKPVVKGSGYTGAVLSDMPTFTALVEYLLCFHAWCHYSSNLPIELQEDFELIAFSSAMVVQYFDTIIYRGDDSVDTDTCKIHSQLHHSYTIARFGDPMQYNTEVGERGLREWAKRLARTALKHG